MDEPKYLYRYMKLIGDKNKNFESILFENKIFYPTKKQLNDKFELTAECIKISNPTEESHIDNVIRLHEGTIEYLFQANQVNPYRQEILADCESFICRIKQKDNSAIEVLKEIFKSGLEKAASNSRVLCFSHKWNNEPMWAHYGQNHKGVVVGMEIKKPETMDGHIVPEEPFGFRMEVKYVDSRMFDYTLGEPLDKLRYDDFRFVFGYFLTEWSFNLKNKDWSYEEEVRFWKSYSEELKGQLQKTSNGRRIEESGLIDKDGKVKFPKNLIKEVIFGLDVSIKKINAIVSRAKSEGLSHVKFYKCKLDKANTKIDRDPIILK
jgi:hypothetical protein